MEVVTQTRAGARDYFSTLREAYEHADKTLDVYRITFKLPTDEWVRLLRMSGEWVLQTRTEDIPELGVYYKKPFVVGD